MSSRKVALISVYSKEGLPELASALSEAGYVILSTGGTGKFLKEKGIQITTVEEFTGQKEILGGRVKTLHPRIHGGILANRDNPEDMNTLIHEEITPIDCVIVNLYPFIQTIKEGRSDLKEMIELIDVGGPTMIRAAAKNHQHVLPLIDSADYSEVISHLKDGREFSLEYRRQLAGKVFDATAYYDKAIATYLLSANSTTEPQIVKDKLCSDFQGLNYKLHSKLRYGENPLQQGIFLSNLESVGLGWHLLQGKPLSYNNVLDLTAVAALVKTFPNGEDTANLDTSLAGLKYGAVIVKHLNPCGAALGASPLVALEHAKLGDPRSHFGGVLGFNFEVTEEVAQNIASDFAELVVAPSFNKGALEIFKKKTSLRVIEYPQISELLPSVEMRSVAGGVLVQESDAVNFVTTYNEVTTATKVAGPDLDDKQLLSLVLAWGLVAKVSSNAITLVKDNYLIGVGAGQMSRIDSVELAVAKAYKHHNHNDSEANLKGAVAASDAFFPFPDSIEYLGLNGISAVIAPSGAKRDEEVIAAANKYGITLLFANYRHFRH